MSRGRLILDLLARGRTYAYGPHRSQRADLYLPAGDGPHPVLILVHGGAWRTRYGRAVMRALAGEERRRGWAAWNIEYRRVGEGGGWPATFEDVAAAVDLLAEIEAPLDRRRVAIAGHSAGGQLALWAASRERLPAGAPGSTTGSSPLRIVYAIAQAGVCDLAGAYERWRGGAVRALMGGGPLEVPERYAAADPMRLVPAPMPVLLVHGTADRTVSVELSRNYARAARAAGAAVELVEIGGQAGGHRAHVDPRGAAWRAVTARLPARTPLAVP